MKRRSGVRNHGLSIFFGVIFLLALGGQTLTGHADFNNQRRTQGREPVSYAHYVTSSDFAVDVAENWQSEYLQFLLYIVATTWLVQRGSPESKKPGDEGRESDEEQKIGEHADADSPRWAATGGWRTAGGHASDDDMRPLPQISTRSMSSSTRTAKLRTGF